VEESLVSREREEDDGDLAARADGLLRDALLQHLHEKASKDQ
jgi:hypothetical protein